MLRSKKSNSPVILAIDQGTTGTKAVLLDSRLKVLGEASREFPQYFPRPGWVEHDLEEIYTSVASAVRAVLEETRVQLSRIAAIGITNQRETTAVWDKQSGKAVHRAIVWQDRRTADECLKLQRAGLEKDFQKKTGLRLDPYFSGTKLAWILKEVSGARKKAETGKLLFGTIDTYLAWRMTGGASHVTDISNASRTLLMDLESCDWSSDLLKVFRVPPALLPEIRANDTVFGHTRGSSFLPDGIAIASVIGDQQSALFGQACFSAGEAKCTYGTGAFLVMNTGQKIVRSQHGLLSTAAWKIKDNPFYALEGSTFIAGAIVQWLRDGLGLVRSSEEIEALARSVKDSEGLVLVPALTGLGAPHWRPEAKGFLTGITRGTSGGHVARAALEGIAFQIHDLVRAMEQDLGRPIKALKVDGGAARNDLLLQFQADVLGSSIVRPRITSTTALGTALLAGLTVGLFASQGVIKKVWEEERRFLPRMGARERAQRVERWNEALEKAVN